MDEEAKDRHREMAEKWLALPDAIERGESKAGALVLLEDGELTLVSTAGEDFLVGILASMIVENPLLVVSLMAKLAKGGIHIVSFDAPKVETDT